jgi:drug/metabolite transporter (DMT)-like permease
VIDVRATLRCSIAAVLFGASAPAASELAGSVPAFTLAGLLYLGAALAVVPSVFRHPPDRRAQRTEWVRVLVAVVAGGAVGPVLLMAGLARTSAATASIALNAELAATVVLAALVYHEHLGRRLVAGTALITGAGVLLVWSPDATLDQGVVLVLAACACWGLDNVVTARIETFSPQHVVALKGVVAGTANLVIGLTLAAPGDSLERDDVMVALVIGAVGYGISIVLWVQGARDLGAARAQAVFSSAPFVGAVVAWLVFDDEVQALQVVALAVAGLGVALTLGTSHRHGHRHSGVTHHHDHRHDDGHHDHDHDRDDRAALRHVHVHTHPERRHTHPHVPDLHHLHDHDG